MKKIYENTLEYYQFENLSRFASLRHFVTTRRGGYSEMPFDSLNLGLHVMDEETNVWENRKKLAETVDVPIENFCFAEQVHEAHCQIITKKEKGRGVWKQDDSISKTDALMTQDKGVCLTMLSADCVPVLLYDQRKEVIAAVHAGWRGSVQKIVQKTVKAMRQQWKCHPHDIYAGIGPCIHVENYEVGEEVAGAVKEAFGDTKGYLWENRATGRQHFDLNYANLQQLLSLGIPAENIEVSKICTYQHSTDFFSARKHKKTGRMAVGIML